MHTTILNGATRPCYHLKIEVFVMLCFQRVQCYTAVQINCCLKSSFVIKVTTMKHADGFCYAITYHH